MMGGHVAFVSDANVISNLTEIAIKSSTSSNIINFWLGIISTSTCEWESIDPWTHFVGNNDIVSNSIGLNKSYIQTTESCNTCTGNVMANDTSACCALVSNGANHSTC